MIDRQLYLLSPYRLPTSYPLQTSADEVSAWLSGYLALWHPAALDGSSRPPAAANTYDHDSPGRGFIYSVPQGPHLYQPDDWPVRVAAVGAVAIAATADRRETIEKLTTALRDSGTSEQLLNLPKDIVRLFAGLGFGYIVVDELFEAMSHDRLLDVPAFWDDVTAAIAICRQEQPDREEIRGHLVSAAEKLRTVREQLHSGPIYWLDWFFLDPDKLDATWPNIVGAKQPICIIASGENLEQLGERNPDRFAELKVGIASTRPGAIDICSGSYRDREDALLPFESQWWNLRQARQTVQKLLGVETTGYARRMSAFHPQLPSWLQHIGFRQAILVSFDGALIPQFRSTAVHWPGPDGRAIDSFAREPIAADDAHTFFNLVYHLHQAISRDSIPTLALIHKGKPTAESYDDLMALSELAPVMGQWTTLSRYFSESVTGDYSGAQPADEFFADYLDQRVTTSHRLDPISAFPRQLRLRRRLDSTLTLAGLHLSLTPDPGPKATASIADLEEVEDAFEKRGLNFPEGEDTLVSRYTEIEEEWLKRLAERIQARSEAGRPGYLIFNPCGFARRVALELNGCQGLLPIVDPIKAGEFEGHRARLVVEVPSLGFAWIPRQGAPGTPPPKPRLKTAEGTTIRNEYLEADIDPTSGGLRALRDLKTRSTRFGQQLVFNPGSKMRATSISISNSGAALGEISTAGEILDNQDAVLATFRQRFRVWMGRPVLEIRTEFDIHHSPAGYPWHSYFGARFGWRDDRAALFRGVNGQNTSTSYTRPVSLDYLEVRFGQERSFLFTGGLPFLQKHGARMIDVVMIPEGEQGRSFDLLLSLDREQPMQTAVGWVSPIPVVESEKGPPPVGPSSWLAHLDMPSLILTTLRPTAPSEGMNRALLAQVIECVGFGGAAELRFARDPAQASVVDGMGSPVQPVVLANGGVPIDYSAGETVRMKIEWA